MPTTADIHPRALGPVPAEDSRAARIIPRVAALLCVALCWVLSLTPFEFRHLRWDQAVALFEVSLQRPGGPIRIDFLANALALTVTTYSCCAAAATFTSARLSRLLAATGVVIGCGALSVLLEFSQVWTPNRYSSRYDILAQWLGTLAGAVAWLSTGRPVNRWLRHFDRSGDSSTRLDLLLQAYVVVLVLGELFPFDVVFHPVDLVHRVRDQLPALMTFRQGWSPELVIGAVFHALLFLPVGIWSGGRERSWARCVLGLSLPLLLEFAQLFVASRHCDATDVITGTIGLTSGILVVRGTVRVRNRIPWSWLATAYLVVPALLLWYPFDFRFDARVVVGGLRSFASIPFQPYVESNYLAVIDNVWRLSLVFFWLGWLWARALADDRGGFRLVGSSILVAFIAIAFELGQVCLVVRYANVTDAGIAATAAVVGAWVARVVLAPASRNVTCPPVVAERRRVVSTAGAR